MELIVYHASFAGILLLLTQSLGLVWRVRLFSLGHHGFYGIGAYTGVVVAQALLPAVGTGSLAPPSNPISGVAILAISIVLGAMAAMGVAWLLMFGLRRARGDAFAVGTLLFAEISRSALTNWDFVGGAMGFELPYLIFDNSSSERLYYVIFYCSLVVAMNIVFYMFIRRWDASEMGLLETALRDDQLAAELSGLDVELWQHRVFVLSAATAGAAGVVFLHFTTLVVPRDFDFINGLTILLCVILAGTSSARCIGATLILYGAMEVIKLRFFGLFGFEIGQQIAGWRDAQTGLFLILAVTVPVYWRRWKAVRKNSLIEESP